MTKTVSHTVVFSSGVVKEIVSDTYSIPGVDLDHLLSMEIALLPYMWVVFTVDGETTGRIRLSAIDGIIPHIED